MTDHEREVIKRTLSYASQEVLASQRCVEVLANLFEGMRRELYPHQAARIWYVLNQIPNLQRVPLSPRERESNTMYGGADNSYRWVFMQHAMLTFHMRQLADYADELSEILSGVKIEEVAQSKAHESWLAYTQMHTPGKMVKE